MARRIGGAANLARVACATLLVAACANAPAGSEPPAGSASPAPALPSAGRIPSPQATSASPTGPGAHAAITWEPLSAFGTDVVRGIDVGPDGWVAAVDCEGGGDTEPPCTTAWSSPDGRSWRAKELPHDGQPPSIWDLAFGAGTYAAIGYDLDETNGRTDPVPAEERGPHVWTSDDGRAWRGPVRTDLWECCPRNKGNAEPFHLGVAPNGTLVLGEVFALHDWYGPFVSRDGRGWEAVEGSAFGGERLWVGGIFRTPSALLLSGGACDGCLDGLWSTVDGRDWNRVARFDIPIGSVSSVATLDGHSVASIHACNGQRVCRTEIWGADEGQAWTRELVFQDGQQLVVGSVDDALIAVGRSGDDEVVLASIDGSTWTRAGGTAIALPRFDDDDDGWCDVFWVAGHGTTVLVGSESCGWFIGSVEVVSGPGEPPGKVVAVDATPQAPPPNPSRSFDPALAFTGSVTIADSCLDDSGLATVNIEASWTGDVPIGDVHISVDDGLGGSVGFPAASDGTQTLGFAGLAPGHDHIALVEFRAEDAALGVETMEAAFTLDPTNRC